MKRTLITAAVATVIAGHASAAGKIIKGPFSFEPQLESAASGSEPACKPFALPEGFVQTVISSENGACPARIVHDAIPGENDLGDMNTVNESGFFAGRFLYRTQETGQEKGAITAMDLWTGQVKTYFGADFGISPEFSRMDGIEWTAWGTLLAAEENGAEGRLFECQVNGLDMQCEDRPAVGRMSHEGIAAARDGTIYVGDELNGGSIYKFVPNQYGDLSAGTLYALNIVQPGPIDGTGTAEWVALIPGQNGVVTAPSVNARAAADEAGVTDYLRPEDAELIGSNLYFATTTDRRVLRIPVNTDTPVVTEFVGVNVGNVNNESEVPTYGLRSPDNLASDLAGNLYIIEDNDPSDIWAAPTKDGNHDGVADEVVLFGTLTTPGAEGTGIYFPPTLPMTMFVNVQHADDGNDMTIAITRLGFPFLKKGEYPVSDSIKDLPWRLPFVRR